MMPLVKGKKAKTKKYVPDSMSTQESDDKFHKNALKDKMNRAPEFNKGIAKGKRNVASSIKV